MSQKIITVFAAACLLTGCLGSSIYDYTETINLSSEQRAALESDVAKWDELIKNPPEEILEKFNNRPAFDYFVEKARAQEYLGQIGKAIKTLEEGFVFYENSSVGWHNLGRLYEKVGDYKKAVKNYQKIIDVFHRYEYNLDVSKAWYKAGEDNKAREAYLLFEEKTGRSDQAFKDELGIK